MPLSSDLISQFVKITKDDTKTKSESTVFGTVVEYEGKKYVRLDGSELLTPVSSVTTSGDGERVVVSIKNHTATVMGNLTAPSARGADVEEIGGKINEFEVIVADKVSTKDLEAINANIENLIADNVTITGKLEANEADIKDLTADNATIRDTLTANKAEIEDLTAGNVTITGRLDAADANIESLRAENAIIDGKLVANEADIRDLKATNVTITGTLEANSADIKDLKADKLTAEDADLKYANIDFANIGQAAMEYFYAQSGLIENVKIGDATISGNLIGVTIKGDLIEGNTIVADKLVIKGTDGLYYKLNTNGVTTEGEQTDYNSLNGTVIQARSITAEKIDVHDLVAFDATIGGFNITDGSLYSGVKESVDNTTKGIYLDSNGQMAIGDGTNFIKLYKILENHDFTNLVPISIDTDDLVYNGTGYKDDTRLSSSGGVSSSSQANSVTTGFMSYTYEYPFIVRTKGVEWLDATTNYGGHWYINIYDDSKSFLSGFPSSAYATDYTSVVAITYDETTGITTFDFSKSHTNTDAMSQAIRNGSYIRLNAYGKGEDLVVTVNEEIGDAVEVYKLVVSASSLTLGGNERTVENVINDLENTTNTNTSLVTTAQTQIDSINGIISNLVTGENGESLMEQTDNGWVFNMASYIEGQNGITELCGELQEKLLAAEGDLDVLAANVTDLGIYTEYIQFGIDNGQPCIMLGEHDSDFKVVITNTDIRFMEGSSIPAYISNQTLNIEKAVVTTELKQGGFVWMARENGNYGLMWKGD